MSRELNTIQKHNKLNTVYAVDEPGNGGANHLYAVHYPLNDDSGLCLEINFQNGARNNPEIVTPQNVMYDTTRRAIEDAQFFNSSNNGQPIYLTVNVGNKKLGQILLEDLRDKVRHTGKDIEALVGG